MSSRGPDHDPRFFFFQGQDLEHFDTKVSGQWGAGCGVSIPGFDQRHVYIYIFNNIYIVNIYIYYIYIYYIYTYIVFKEGWHQRVLHFATKKKNRLRLQMVLICWPSKVLSSEDLKTQRTESGLTQCRKDKKGALMLGLNPMHLQGRLQWNFPWQHQCGTFPCFFLTVKCVFGWLSLEVWLQVRMVGFYDCMVYHRITIGFP